MQHKTRVAGSKAIEEVRAGLYGMDSRQYPSLRGRTTVCCRRQSERRPTYIIATSTRKCKRPALVYCQIRAFEYILIVLIPREHVLFTRAHRPCFAYYSRLHYTTFWWRKRFIVLTHVEKKHTSANWALSHSFTPHLEGDLCSFIASVDQHGTLRLFFRQK